MTSVSAGIHLQRLLDDKASAADIGHFLDGLADRERVEAVLGLTGRRVKQLYQAVRAAPPLRPEELVRPGAAQTVFEGRNSLPAFSRFQKRFATCGNEVIGYNHQSTSFLTGPGYFVVLAPSGDGDHADELVFDYTRPPLKTPSESEWPPYRANDKGLGRLVFMNMKDYVRRVARGVVVGSAYKLGKDQDTYFSLSTPD